MGDSLYYETGPYGSFKDGSWFTDFRQDLNGRHWQPIHWPEIINIRAGEAIDGIQIFYGNYQGYFHGGEGGFLHRIRLYNGDRITKVTGRAGIGPGADIDQLTFHTRSGRIHGPFGGDGGRYFEAIPPEPYNRDGKKIDCFLGWISGQSDRRLDAISFHWKCPKEPSHNRREEAQNFEKEYHKPVSTNYVSNSNYAIVFSINVLLIFLTFLFIQFVKLNRNHYIHKNDLFIAR